MLSAWSLVPLVTSRLQDRRLEQLARDRKEAWEARERARREAEDKVAHFRDGAREETG